LKKQYFGRGFSAAAELAAAVLFPSLLSAACAHPASNALAAMIAK
jgi:hypothetical protein